MQSYTTLGFKDIGIREKEIFAIITDLTVDDKMDKFDDIITDLTVEDKMDKFDDIITDLTVEDIRFPTSLGEY